MQAIARHLKLTFLLLLVAACGVVVFARPAPVHAQDALARYAYVKAVVTGTPPTEVIRIVATDPGGHKTTCVMDDSNDPHHFTCSNSNIIVVSSTASTSGTLFRTNLNQDPSRPSSGSKITIGGDTTSYNKYVAANPGTPQDKTGTGDPELECGTAPFSFDWLMCPMTKSISFIVTQVDKLIVNMLLVDQNGIFNQTTATGKDYYKAWTTFRSLALAILLIAGLAMVIAQGLGFEVLDAYTIKKIMPRLIMAIIGISLSWDLMHFFISFTNDLGLGVRHIIYWPFRGFDQSIKLDTTASLAALLLSGAALLAFGIFGLLTFAVTALLAVAVAFLVLVIRQLIIVILILFAPIAIACFILPNTQGIWKLWHESFTKALLMFPIIMAFLAIGRVFAITSISGSTTGTNVYGDTHNAINQLIGFAAYFMPYFLIPLTFRFAGGAMRTFGGMVNDRSRGGFDRLRKARGNILATRGQKMKQGTLYRPTNPLARGFNAASHNVAMAPKAGLNPFEMKSRFNSAKTEHALAAMEDVRKNPSFIAGSQDDRVLRAAERGRGLAGIKEHLRTQEGVTDPNEVESLAGTALRMQSSGPRQAVQSAIALQKFATGTGYTKKDANGNEYFDYDDAFASIRNASGGDRALAGSLLGQAKGAASQSGQLAFGGASYGTLSKGLTEKFEGRAVGSGSEMADSIALDAYDSTDAVSAARARGVHLQTMASAATKRINDIDSQPALAKSPGELGARTAQLESWSQTTGMYGAPNRQQIVNDTIPVAEAAMKRVSEEFMRSQRPPAAAPTETTTSPIVVVSDWRPGQPIPQNDTPGLRPTAPAPAPPPPTPRPSANAEQYGRNRSGRMSATDPRTREQLDPRDDH